MGANSPATRVVLGTAALVATMAAFIPASTAGDLVDELASRGLIQPAIDELEMAVRTTAEPDECRAQLERLATLYEASAEDPSAAAAAYVRILDLLPADGSGRDAILYALGRALEAAGDCRYGIVEYERVLTDYPESRFSERAMEGVERCFSEVRPAAAAFVGGHVVTVERLDAVVKQLAGPDADSPLRQPEGRRKVLDQMVEEYLMADLARERGLHLEGEVRREIETMVNRHLANLALNRLVRAEVQVKPMEVRAAYDAERDSRYLVQDRVRGFTFVAPTEEEAQGIYKSLQADGFRDAKHQWWKVSQEAGGGDSGLQVITDIDPEVAKELDGIEVLQALAPRHTGRGWEVFYLQVRKRGGYTPYDGVRAKIENRLRGERERDRFRAVVDSLKTARGVNVIYAAETGGES